jgi:hypothetical protein
MVEAQAFANDATYVDWYTPSIGHDACEPPGRAWVNGAVIFPPSYPAHPNASGMNGVAFQALMEIRSAGVSFGG